MTYSLTHFLPYAESIRLNSLSERLRVLRVLAFFSQSTYAAIQDFISGKYDNFDAQVSENLCQIRAYQLIQLSMESNEHSKSALMLLARRSKEVELKCQHLFSEYTALRHTRPSHYTKQIDEAITLQAFLENENIEVSFSEVAFFLVQAFVLSKYKLVGDYEISYGMDYDTLCNEIGVPSKTYVRKIVHLLQRNLSKESCQFIFKLLFDLNATPAHINLLRSLYFQDEVGRNVISCYEVTRVLLQHALQTHKQLQIIVKRISRTETDAITFYLKTSMSNDTFSIIPNDSPGNAAVMVFSGISRYDESLTESKEQYVERFLDAGIENIILSNMAQHPQYAGLLLNDKKFNPYQGLNKNVLPSEFVDYINESEKQFLKHKYLSAQIGCNEKESSLFLLTHVRTNAHPIHSFQPEMIE